MIDKVKLTLKQEYDISLFEKNNFKYKVSKKWQTKYFYKTINNVSVLYFIEKEMLMISGRIIYLYNNRIGKVKNFDDVMIDEQVPFDYILETIEKNLMKLFFPNQAIVPSINLNDFDVKYIEYCVNINVEKQHYVDAYIIMMNTIFIDKADPRYINFVIETRKELNTSSYIKSNKKYQMNSQTGTTINFYNKFNQLYNQTPTRWKNKNKLLHDESLEESYGILRLEVKYGSQILYQFRKKDGLSLQFKDYKNIYFAYKLITDKLKRFYSQGDFKSYKEIKNIINNSQMTDLEKKNIMSIYPDYARKLGQELKSLKKVDHNFNNYYKRKIKALGINPVPIPTKFDIKKLECPVKLLDKKRERLIQTLEALG